MTPRAVARSSERSHDAVIGQLVLVAATGFFVLAVARQPTVATGVLAGLFGVGFVSLAYRDLRDRVVPNRIVYPLLMCALVLSPLWPDRGLPSSLGGMLAGGGAMAVVFVASRGGLGAGDVKMAALLGAVVGFPGVVTALALTAVVGGLAALCLVAVGQRQRGISYAPFLALGAAGALLVSGSVSIW